MTREIKQFELTDIELKDEGGVRTVEGYASVFNNVDSYKDIVLPGAFAKTLKKKRTIPMLWQHDAEKVIGVWNEMEERERGLYVKGTIAKTSRGDEAYELLKMVAISGMSIGYSTRGYEIDSEKGTRKLTDLELFEVSLVTFPANEKAQVTRVKAAHSDEREFEEFLREAGYGREAAKVITAKGFKSLESLREAGNQVDYKTAITAITKATNILKGL